MQVPICLSRESSTEKKEEEKKESAARGGGGRSKVIKDEKKIRALPRTQKLLKQVRIISNLHAIHRGRKGSDKRVS